MILSPKKKKKVREESTSLYALVHFCHSHKFCLYNSLLVQVVVVNHENRACCDSCCNGIGGHSN